MPETYSKDLEIVVALLNKDKAVTSTFFFEECRGMLTGVIKKVFNNPTEYDELINALYLYIMENDAYRLRQYKGRSSIYLWLRTTATRFFIQYRNQVIDNTSQEPLLIGAEEEPIEEIDENIDEDIRIVRDAFDSLPNRRYAYVLQRLVINEVPPAEVAQELGVTIDNLYNIKKRALTQLTQQLTQNGIRKR